MRNPIKTWWRRFICPVPMAAFKPRAGDGRLACPICGDTLTFIRFWWIVAYLWALDMAMIWL